MNEQEVLTLDQDIEGSSRRARALFEHIREELSGALPPGVLIEHVGATAVPGCVTKGDLDIAVRVHVDRFENSRAVLSTRFEDNSGSIRTPAFAAFADPSSDPPVGIQLVVIGSELDVFTRFRDALRANPVLVARYNGLKHAWNGRDMEGYRSAKSRFIDQVVTGAAI